jgi:methionyl-tRNA formyltransferase
MQCEKVRIQASNIESILPVIASLQFPLGCVVGWHQIFPRKVVDAFRKRLLNIHTGDLPRYRGAGGGSWQVLNDARRIVAHVQQMQFAIDRGPLLYGEHVLLPVDPYPLDVKAAARLAIECALVWLGSAIAECQTVPLLHQDEYVATYFPRLDSGIHAWLDLTWTCDEVERFIRAFSDPYPGAAFRYGDSRYRVRRATIREDDVYFHPFCAGLIVNSDERAVHVALTDGVLCFEKISDESGLPMPSTHFRVGDRIWSDPDEIARARQVRRSFESRDRGRAKLRSTSEQPT